MLSVRLEHLIGEGLALPLFQRTDQGLFPVESPSLTRPPKQGPGRIGRWWCLIRLLEPVPPGQGSPRARLVPAKWKGPLLRLCGSWSVHELLPDRVDELRKQGFVRARVGGGVISLDEDAPGDADAIEAVIDRLVVGEGIARRLADSLETALSLNDGVILVDIPGQESIRFTTRFHCVTCDRTVPPQA